MEEKTQMLASMSLTFGGQNSIEADVLMASLDSALRAYKATLLAEYDGQDADITLNICAFALGSVKVLLESVVGIVPLIAPQVPTVIESTKHFLEIIKLKKELRGKKPCAVENEGGKVKITNQDGQIHYHNSTVYNIFINNPSIDAGLVRMFGTLAESQRPIVSFGAASEKVEIEKTAYSEMQMAIVDELKEVENHKIETVVNEQLLLKSPDLLGHSKWEFYYDGKVISASIEDEEFNESVRKGKIKLYAGIKIPEMVKRSAERKPTKCSTWSGGTAEGSPTKYCRRQSTQIRRVDPVLVVVDENIAEHQRFHLVHRHAIGRDSVEKLFFERGEEAFHPCVVIAMRDAAEALRDAAGL